MSLMLEFIVNFFEQVVKLDPWSAMIWSCFRIHWPFRWQISCAGHVTGYSGGVAPLQVRTIGTIWNWQKGCLTLNILMQVLVRSHVLVLYWTFATTWCLLFVNDENFKMGSISIFWGTTRQGCLCDDYIWLYNIATSCNYWMQLFHRSFAFQVIHGMVLDLQGIRSDTKCNFRCSSRTNTFGLVWPMFPRCLQTVALSYMNHQL